MCRSRRELSNAYFLAKFRFDTAENEPSGDDSEVPVDDRQLAHLCRRGAAKPAGPFGVSRKPGLDPGMFILRCSCRAARSFENSMAQS